jgi:hypothetical protein
MMLKPEHRHAANCNGLRYTSLRMFERAGSLPLEHGPPVLAPIALITYRRPQHLERTLAALKANPEARHTTLYVFSDAPKDASAAEGVEQVRCLLAGVDGFAAVHRVFRGEHFGLAPNVTQGVQDVLVRHESVIVVEDDIVVSPFFLRFMNDALCCYRDEPRVGSVSGYCYPLPFTAPETFFIRGADCWSWATWRDRWQYYNPDGRTLLAQLRRLNLTSAFDFDGAMGFTRMLEDQIAGRNSSWAVRWQASCFLRDLLVLYPARSLARNIGNDGSGTHSTSTSTDDVFDVTLSPAPVAVGSIPIEENALGWQSIREFFLKTQPQQVPAVPPQLVPMQPGDVPETCADVDDLMRDLGFRPATPIEEGVRRFASWFREFFKQQ